MMKKYILLALLLCLVIMSNAQTDSKKPSISFEPTTVEGCQYEEEIYECSQEKLQRTTFKFLTPSDVIKVAESTTKDTIFVYTRLYTDSIGKVIKDRSSLKFYERQMRPLTLEPTSSLDDFQIELAPLSKQQSSFISGHLFLKIDRVNTTFIPLYDYIPKRIPFSGPEVGVVYPGCQKAKTEDEKKHCMATKISEFVAKKFNSRLGSKLGLDGIQRIYVVFKINTEGRVVDIRTRAPHPELAKEAERVVKKLPRMQPATVENELIAVNYTLPIVFKVVDKQSNKKKRN